MPRRISIITQRYPQIMAQTLKLGIGRCKNHLLYIDVWAQVTR